MSGMYPDLATLLSAGRPATHIVARGADGDIVWEEFSRKIALGKARSLRGQRQLLMHGDPVEFAADLLGTLAAGGIAVIAPNFQQATLDDLRLEIAALPIAETPAIELFTSGSTGTPKRIVKKPAQLEAECRALEALWGAEMKQATVLATVPHHHIYGLLFRIFWPLLAGRPFDAVTAGEPSTLHERLTVTADAVLVSSPAQLARLPELHDLNAFPKRPRLIFSSGGPLPAEVAQTFADGWQTTPHEVFGSTESGGIATRQQNAGNVAWTPLPEVSVTRDEDGALLVRSPFLDDASALRMEDAIRLEADGRFVLSGRLDRIVKIEEKRLSLPDLEGRLASHPWISACVAAPVLANNGRRTVVGIVATLSTAGWAALHHSRREATETLRGHLAQHFDHVLLPRRWRFVDSLPYNERGKLPRDAVLALLNTPATEELPA